MSVEQTTMSQEHIQTDWALAVYGIPTEQTQIRRRVCRLLRRHGFWSIDIGGSVYTGPIVPELDGKLHKLLQELASKFRLTEALNIHWIIGDFDAATTTMFRDQVLQGIREDQAMIEENLDELQRALAGQATITDNKGKVRDLLTTGASRLDAAEKLLADMEAVIERYNKAQGLGDSAKK